MAKLPTEEKIYELWLKLLNDCEAKDWLPTKNLWLGVLDITRQTYSRWIKKSDAIKKVDKEIENAWVQRLKLNNVAGIIFYLKNAFGYRDRQDLNLPSGIIKITFDKTFNAPDTTPKPSKNNTEQSKVQDY